MAGIFLSYRRTDATGWAGRLHDSLVQRLPGVKIFMDVEEIPPGVKFADYIQEAVGSCDLLLALIGPSWLTATKGDGGRRLDDPHDFVGLEIAAALERGVRVVPTLVGGAAMPTRDDLPHSLKELCDRQNYELPDRAWEDGCNRLANALRGIVKTEQIHPAKPPARKALAVGGSLAALLLGLSGVAIWGLREGKQGPGPVPVAGPASAARPASGLSVATNPDLPALVPISPRLPAAAASRQAGAVAGSSARAGRAPDRLPNTVLSEGAATPTVAVSRALRPARPSPNMDEELWATAESVQKRASYLDYLFRFPSGVHAASAQAKAGAFWMRDASSGCALLEIGAPSGEQPKVEWKGACVGGKAQGQGILTVEYPEQKRMSVSKKTEIAGLDNGPCSRELKVEGTLRARFQGTCIDSLEGNVAHKFDGKMEVYAADGTLESTFTGTYTNSWSGELEFRGERTLHKTDSTFSGTENGELRTGTVKYKSGATIRCKFIKGKANGSNCEIRYADGGSYTGDLKDGQREGRGVMYYPSSGTYEGDFRDGKEWGRGVITNTDGSKVIGNFVAGKIDGDAVIIGKDGQRTSAHFVAGVRDR